MRWSSDFDFGVGHLFLFIVYVNVPYYLKYHNKIQSSNNCNIFAPTFIGCKKLFLFKQKLNITKNVKNWQINLTFFDN